MRVVRPVTPPAAYIGGKRNLARRIVPLIEGVPHTTYAEPFVGMGGIFFKRTQVPKAEVVNDVSSDVATLFRMLQRHYVAFMDMLKYQLTTRSTFERLVATDPSTLTDLERAARFLYIQRLAFGGKVSGRTFGVSVGMPARFDITKLAPLLEAVHERLAGVVIESLSFEQFIPRYDRPDTLFYCDPPYFESEGDYGKDLFTPASFEVLAGLMEGVKGKMIVSINDTPRIRTIFRHFNMLEVSTTYTIGVNNHQKVTELVITNF